MHIDCSGHPDSTPRTRVAGGMVAVRVNGALTVEG